MVFASKFHIDIWQTSAINSGLPINYLMASDNCSRVERAETPVTIACSRYRSVKEV